LCFLWIGFAASSVVTAAVTVASAREFIISVPGIPGPYCAYGIEKRLAQLPGVTKIELLWKEAQIRATVADDSSLTMAQIEEAVRRADYPCKFGISLRE
jgi:copper chaperone CopZ